MSCAFASLVSRDSSSETHKSDAERQYESDDPAQRSRWGASPVAFVHALLVGDEDLPALNKDSSRSNEDPRRVTTRPGVYPASGRRTETGASGQGGAASAPPRAGGSSDA